MFFAMTTNIRDYLPDTVYTMLGLATVFLSLYMFMYADKKGKIRLLWMFIGLYFSFFGFLFMLWVVKQDEKKLATKVTDTELPTAHGNMLYSESGMNGQITQKKEVEHEISKPENDKMEDLKTTEEIPLGDYFPDSNADYMDPHNDSYEETED